MNRKQFLKTLALGGVSLPFVSFVGKDKVGPIGSGPSELRGPKGCCGLPIPKNEFYNQHSSWSIGSIADTAEKYWKHLGKNGDIVFISPSEIRRVRFQTPHFVTLPELSQGEIFEIKKGDELYTVRNQTGEPVGVSYGSWLVTLKDPIKTLELCNERIMKYEQKNFS